MAKRTTTMKRKTTLEDIPIVESFMASMKMVEEATSDKYKKMGIYHPDEITFHTYCLIAVRDEIEGLRRELNDVQSTIQNEISAKGTRIAEKAGIKL